MCCGCTGYPENVVSGLVVRAIDCPMDRLILCAWHYMLQVLQTVLAIGNYMNGSTSRGRAYGFKL